MTVHRVQIKPSGICIDASTLCQLQCPTCPRAHGDVGKNIGAGFLKTSDFKKIIDDNPWVKQAELSNWGEIFLNPELEKILEYAFEKKICLRASNGANLNDAREEALEALVKYRLNAMTCSIDGACQETYEVYRRGGNFNTVIENIKKINQYKKKYNSQLPYLHWQFVAFGHNEHEIAQARRMAHALGMSFSCKLSWNDLYYENVFSPVKNKNLIRRESGTGAATREEYMQKYGRDYMRLVCTQLWANPQVNFDGKVLGCCINYWSDFGDALKENLLDVLNGEKMNYARQMLLGNRQERQDIPCAACKIYKNMKEKSAWLTNHEIQPMSLKKNIKKLLKYFPGASLVRTVKKKITLGMGTK